MQRMPARRTAPAGVPRPPRCPSGPSTATKVTVRYTYYEPGEEDTDWPQVFHKPFACTGTGERQFTVERTKLGLQVVDMTGPRRD